MKLIYIDNDGLENATKDCGLYVSPMLEAYGGLSRKRSQDIRIISDLYKMNKDELYKLFYSGENAILSWSVYTATSYSNSRAQLLHFLRVAGTSDVKNVVYMDMSGMISDTLSHIKYEEIKSLWQILSAIQNNYIITLKNGAYWRVTIDFKSKDGLCLEGVNISEIL